MKTKQNNSEHSKKTHPQKKLDPSRCTIRTPNLDKLVLELLKEGKAFKK